MITQHDTISPEGALEHDVVNDAKGNRLLMALLIAAIAASGLSLLFSIGTAVLSANQSSHSASADTKQTTPERTLGTVGHPSLDAQGGRIEPVAHTMGVFNPARLG